MPTMLRLNWFALEPERPTCTCLLYTSDAADERSSVDLGGRRIIKKKQQVATLRAQWQDNQHKKYQSVDESHN